MTPTTAIAAAATVLTLGPALMLAAITARREAALARAREHAWQTWRATGRPVPGWDPAWIWTTPREPSRPEHTQPAQARRGGPGPTPPGPTPPGRATA